MLAVFGYISGALSAICFLPYIRNTLQGHVQPERATWFIWSVLGSIIFFSQLSEGASHSLWLPGVKTSIAVIVFILSLKFGIGGLIKRDILGLVAAGIGISFWLLTDEAILALFLAIAVDSIGGILAAIKAYKHPHTEIYVPWILSGTAGLFAVLSVGQANYVLLAYPVEILVTNFAVVGAIYLGMRKTR